MSHCPHVSSLRRLSVILLVLGLGAALVWGFAMLKTSSPQAELQLTPAVHQQEFAARRFCPQLCLLSAQQLAALPVVDGFQFPCGSPNGALVYDAQPLGGLNEKRGGLHSGADFNGVGGGNSDLGLPVYAVARGLVVYSGVPSDAWGQVVVLAHLCPDGRVVQSLYAHLQGRCVRRGQLLARGDCLGALGDAEGHYVAHLHFELREGLCIPVAQRAYLAKLDSSYLCLEAMMEAFPAPEVGDCFHALRRVRARSAIQFVPTVS